MTSHSCVLPSRLVNKRLRVPSRMIDQSIKLSVAVNRPTSRVLGRVEGVNTSMPLNELSNEFVDS